VVESIFGRVPDVEINYTEHAGQSEISEALQVNFASLRPASVIEIIASRGWGKTLYFVCSVLVPYLDQHPNARAMWVAPTYSTAQTPVDDIFRGTDELTDKRYVPEFDARGNRVWEFVTTKSGPVLKWFNGATVSFKSADAPDSIVSKGFNLIVIDEAALIQEQVFTQQILGTARRRGIKIFMISSPRGKQHWTYKIFLKGQDRVDSDYLSFQQPYTKNPFFSPVLKKLIRDIPEWLYRQEYMAEFVDDGDSVFRGLDGVMYGPEISFESEQQEWTIPIKDNLDKDGKISRKAHERSFVAGLDFAKQKDFTVLTVIDLETAELVYYRRLNKEDYRKVLDMAAEVCKRFNHCDLIFDATGVGAGLADMLNSYDVTAHPFVFTNDSKNEIVNKLILSIEYQELKLPNIAEIKKELAAFTYSLTRTGKISYNAPSGFHDDVVMSLAMANFYRKENVGADDLGVVDDIISINRGGYSRPASFRDQMANDND
jgi:hypothetical protein